MTPLEMLQKELTTIERDLKKSVEMFESLSINADTHVMHLRNIEPKIKEFKEAITILQYYYDERNTTPEA
jgi:hypothetical protein